MQEASCTELTQLDPPTPFLSLNWWDGVSVLEFRQHGDLHPEKAPVFAFKHLS